MLKHLLVPLDGSKMSEAVLAPTAELAAKAGARVTLLHVIERGAHATVHGQRHLVEPREAEQYLREVAARGFPAGVPVGWHVHRRRIGRVAHSLVRHADQLQPDLIIMCSHGPVRLRDRVLGNIAQQTIHRQAVPVLLFRSQPGRPCFPFRNVLVPLDGQTPHEHGLAPAAEMARLCGAGLVLITVVPTAGELPGEQAASATLLPSATRQFLDLRQQQAVEYLRAHVEWLRAVGLDAHGQVARGAPDRLIQEAAEELGVDLIALGTHGKAGTDAFWSGSLTPKLLRRAKTSFLLVPVPDAPDGSAEAVQ